MVSRNSRNSGPGEKIGGFGKGGPKNGTSSRAVTLTLYLNNNDKGRFYSLFIQVTYFQSALSLYDSAMKEPEIDIKFDYKISLSIIFLRNNIRNVPCMNSPTSKCEFERRICIHDVQVSFQRENGVHAIRRTGSRRRIEETFHQRHMPCHPYKKSLFRFSPFKHLTFSLSFTQNS